jgi:hypothetical protein
MEIYAQRSEAALASKISARGVELDVASAARLNRFAVFRQTAVCRTSMTDRSRKPQQMLPMK